MTEMLRREGEDYWDWYDRVGSIHPRDIPTTSALTGLKIQLEDGYLVTIDASGTIHVKEPTIGAGIDEGHFSTTAAQIVELIKSNRKVMTT